MPSRLMPVFPAPRVGQSLFVFSAICGVLLFTGCGGSSNGRYALSGSVNFQGAPLDSGAIEFVAPDASQQTGGTIQDGSYSIPAANGLPPGKYKVKITSVESAEVAGPPGPESMKPTGKDKIPAAYNSATTQEVEVTAGGANAFDFDIP